MRPPAALTERPDLLAEEAELVCERGMTWRGRLRGLGDYGRAGGSAADRRTIVEYLAVVEAQSTSDDGPRLRWLVELYEEALEAIRGPLDDPNGLDWRAAAYREAGGGYEGLQAIAHAALATGCTAEGD